MKVSDARARAWREHLADHNARKVLFDTTTLLDALDAKRPESDEACRALRYCNGGGDTGLVTPGTLKDVYYVLRKLIGERFARRAINGLLDLLVVVPLSAEGCLMAAASDEPDFEDAQVRAAAELNGVTFILTRDRDAFQNSHIRSITCAEYCRIVGV